MIADHFLKSLIVKPGRAAKLDQRETGWAYTDELRQYDKEQLKATANVLLEANRHELSKAQDIFYATRKYSALLILQGLDAGGKDGTIKHVMSGVNPQGCQVSSFKEPTAYEKNHDFLWRYRIRMPEKGMMGIFNRSYYEDVLVVRVHPELIGAALPKKKKDQEAFWEKRYESINALERHLTLNGTIIIKCFLHISREEQKKRLLARLDDPSKHWKFSMSDVEERKHWADYRDAFEKAITTTSTEWAPWWVVPADHKWVARTVVAELLTRSLEKLDLQYPQVSAEQEKLLQVVRKKLEED